MVTKYYEYLEECLNSLDIVSFGKCFVTFPFELRKCPQIVKNDSFSTVCRFENKFQEPGSLDCGLFSHLAACQDDSEFKIAAGEISS
jgi:hypothetical protein